MWGIVNLVIKEQSQNIRDPIFADIRNMIWVKMVAFQHTIYIFECPVTIELDQFVRVRRQSLAFGHFLLDFRTHQFHIDIFHTFDYRIISILVIEQIDYDPPIISLYSETVVNGIAPFITFLSSLLQYAAPQPCVIPDYQVMLVTEMIIERRCCQTTIVHNIQNSDVIYRSCFRQRTERISQDLFDIPNFRHG